VPPLDAACRVRRFHVVAALRRRRTDRDNEIVRVGAGRECETALVIREGMHRVDLFEA
jgi:hypothetical protein